MFNEPVEPWQRVLHVCSVFSVYIVPRVRQRRHYVDCGWIWIATLLYLRYTCRWLPHHVL